MNKERLERWVIILIVILLIVSIITLFIPFSYYNLQMKLKANFKEKTKSEDNLEKYLQLVNDEYSRFGSEDQDKFFTYIKESRDDIITLAVENRVPFITNMPLRYRLKHFYEEKKTIPIPVLKTREEYIKDIGLFLSYYKNTSNKPHSKKKYDLSNQSEYKKYLVWLWRYGSYITRTLIEGEKDIQTHVDVFSLEVDSLVTPLTYDWFLFASHYPIIMCYKLFIDYKTKGSVDEKYANNVFRFIPKPNYSRHIQRYKSNASITSMSYIIASIFTKENYEEIVKNFFSSSTFEREIIINIQTPENEFQDGLYIDGGFIIHKNLVSYNYLLAYLYPSLFFEYVFKIDTGNITKIINALNKIRFKSRKINPSLISRYGKFNEVSSTLTAFESNSKALGMKYSFEESNKMGIEIIESARVVVANYPDWSFQYKINSELAYGEVDIKNNAIIKQMSMMKLLFTDTTDIEDMSSYSHYPGVLSYGIYLKNAETIQISKGTKTFVFGKVKYLFHFVNKDLVIIASKVRNDEFKIAYKEVIIIHPFGICVVYLDIMKAFRTDLWLIASNAKFNGKIIYPLLIDSDRVLIENQAMYYSSPLEVNTPTMELEEDGTIHFNELTFTIDEDGLIFK